MRASRLVAGMALAFGIAAAVHAQQAPYESVVVVPEVEVRSGPSAQYYPTTKLRQGTSVRVLEEKDGWLSIVPPPGSFSWINGRLIDRTGRIAVVVTEAPVRVGSSVSKQKPDVEQVKLARGAQVIVLGEAHVPPDDPSGGMWWPIQPPPQEVRWVPKDSIKTSATVEAALTSATSPPEKGWPVPTGVPPAGGSLLDQAKQAEASGNGAKAIELYTQVYRQNIDLNHALAMDALNRVHYLQNGYRPSVPAGYQPGVPNEATSGQTVSRVQPSPVPPTPPPAPVQPSNTQVGYAAQPPVAPLVQPGSPPMVRPSGPGRLRRAGFFVEGKQAYVLENSQGQTLYYVTAQSGLNLEPYVNHSVELFGPVVYHGELRNNYMTVGQVNMLQ